jgi:prepilin-type N-terminal cleavage/methylation domain-containing protein
MLMPMLKTEKGSTLIEILVGIALLGVISVAFLTSLTAASGSLIGTQEHAAAQNIAQSQMEHVKQQLFAASYNPEPLPETYADFSVVINTVPVGDGAVQKIMITVARLGNTVSTLEGYKAR